MKKKQEMEVKIKRAKPLIYLSAVIGLGYTFWDKIKTYGWTSTITTGIVISVLFVIIFIEGLFILIKKLIK